MDWRAHLVDGIGLWRQVLRPVDGPALFLDRDGVVIDDLGYLRRAEDVVVIDGAAAVIGACNARAVPVVLVTNQAGIGRGYYEWADFAAVQERLHALLGEAGAALDMVLACAFHEDGVPPHDVADHPWRKPGPGMLLAAGEAMGLDLAQSWIVGDKAIDMAAGRAAGVAGGFHVATGHGAQQRESALAVAGGGFDVRAGAGIADAMALVALLAGADEGAP